MVKKITYLLFTMLFSIGLIAQTSEEDYTDEYVLEGEDYVIPFDSLSTKDRVHVGFEMGAGFGRSSSYGDYFSTYYKPTMSYEVSPRFRIITGLTYINSSVDHFPVLTDYSYQLFSGNISQYNAFVGGQYKLTDKLSVGGSVFYDFTSFNALDGTVSRTSPGLENLGYSANFRYKVRDGLFIEGEVRMGNRNPYNNRRATSFSNGFMGMGTSFFEQ